MKFRLVYALVFCLAPFVGCGNRPAETVAQDAGVEVPGDAVSTPTQGQGAEKAPSAGEQNLRDIGAVLGRMNGDPRMAITALEIELARKELQLGPESFGLVETLSALARHHLTLQAYETADSGYFTTQQIQQFGDD